MLGAGGIGGLVAATSGALCIGTERTVDAIRAQGLRLRHGGTTVVSRPEAATRLERPVGLLVVAVKAYDLDAAFDRIAPGALDDAVILPLLNGLEHVEAIRMRLAGGGRVAAGSIGRVSAASPEPGVVVWADQAGGRITAASRQLDRATLEARLEPLAAPGLAVAFLDDEREVLWKKVTRLAVLAMATVASGLTIGPLRDDARWRERMRAAVDEAVAAAGADGVTLAAADQWAMIEDMPAELTTSAARDAAAGKATELDAIAGSVRRAGARHGVPMPVFEELLADAERTLTK